MVSEQCMQAAAADPDRSSVYSVAAHSTAWHLPVGLSQEQWLLTATIFALGWHARELTPFGPSPWSTGGCHHRLQRRNFASSNKTPRRGSTGMALALGHPHQPACWSSVLYYRTTAPQAFFLHRSMPASVLTARQTFSRLACLLCGLMRAAATLPQFALYPQGLSGPTPVQNVLPKQTYTLASTDDLSRCNKAECDQTGGSLSAATANYCDMSAAITVCICGGAPYTTNR